MKATRHEMHMCMLGLTHLKQVRDDTDKTREARERVRHKARETRKHVGHKARKT